MKHIQFLIAILFYTLFIQPIAAQQVISGTVTDADTQEPLTGVTLRVSNTNRGTVTDLKGNFSITASPSELLSVSFVGYQTKVVSAAEAMLITLTATNTILNQVVVSASRDAQLRTDTPIAISTLSTKLLEETKATSLDQVLNKATGVLMVDLGNEQHTMSIRQPISYKSLFLYLEDGLPVRPTGIFNHNALMEMNMAMVQNIEIIRGPASSLYGSEAVGGAINFITYRTPAKTSGKISLQGDNYGYRRTDFRFGTPITEKLGVNIGGYYAQRKNGYLDYSDFHKAAFTVNLDYRFNENTKLESTTSLMDYRSDMGSSVDSASFFEQKFESLHTFTQRELQLFRTQLKLTHHWNKKSHTVGRVFYRNNTMGQIPSYYVKNNWTNPAVATGEINESSFQSYGALVQHNQSFAPMNMTLRTGVSLDYSPSSNWAEFIAIDRDEQGRYINYATSDSLLTRYNTDLLNAAIYAQLELKPTERLQVVAAMRYDSFRYDYNNQLDATAFSGAPDAVNSFQAFTPKLGLTYDFGNGFGAYANYSIGFVPPQVSELYRGVKVPSLAPSVYFNYEAGGWTSLPANLGYLEVSVYQMDGTDEIISVSQEDGSSINQNAGKTLHRGIEYTLRMYPVKGVSLRVSGTNAIHKFMEMNDGKTDFAGNRMDAAPSFIANMELGYKPVFLKGFRTSLEWQHVGAYYMDAANTEMYNGFDVFNLRLGYTYKRFDTWINTINLTDEMYSTKASKSAWGQTYTVGAPRTFQLGIGYQF
ncbi:TonB-dependent receptor [Limibacter armeniacum]|uniref:TonB-dependent receptor n=1 Tax=Limibacter armeniacum TaxID=466084 RepID=UPI002FE6AE96